MVLNWFFFFLRALVFSNVTFNRHEWFYFHTTINEYVSGKMFFFYFQVCTHWIDFFLFSGNVGFRFHFEQHCHCYRLHFNHLNFNKIYHRHDLHVLDHTEIFLTWILESTPDPHGNPVDMVRTNQSLILRSSGEKYSVIPKETNNEI